MVKVGLQISANLENITNLKASDCDFRWYLKLKCLNCGEESDKWHYLSLNEKFPLKSGRGCASLVVKCKLCSRENSIDILEDTLSSYTADDCNKFKTIIAFDCRGLEPISFSPRLGFSAEGAESGTKFADIDLTELEWVDYDEKASESVGIYETKHQFIKL